jgi:YidC/Oxa1 family membrane protein insertase
MGNNDNLRRILIATLISFVFFVAYDYFVLQPQQKAFIKAQKQEKKELKSNKLEIFNNTSKVVATIEAKNYEVKIDSLGRISSFILKQNKFNENGKHLELVAKELPKPLEIRFKNEELNKLAFNTPVKVDKEDIILNDSSKTITITQKLNDIKLIKKITFYPDGHYDIDIKLNKNLTYFISPGFRPEVAIDKLSVHGAILKKSDGKLEIIEDGDVTYQNINSAIFTAEFDRYYTTLLFSKTPVNVVVENEKNTPVTYIKLNSNASLTGYIGPKFVDTLVGIDPTLVDAVQYGVGTFFAKNLFFVLDFLYKLVNNWGIAIILLVVLVRIILFPLTFKGMVSMYKLKELAPKMKEIQERYKKDPQKLQMHMMKLYKEEKVNPLGGCLPLLLQIPIFYGIYKLLLYAIELKGAHFLWIKDLSGMDPFFILPILMGVTMYLHQKITPTNFQDPMQEKIFKFLPVIFTIMMATFPAGLVLYWTINNILSIVQQLIINKTMQIKAKK